MCSITYATAGVALFATTSGMPILANTSTAKVASQLEELQQLPQTITAVKAPTLKEPEWLKQQNAAEAAAAAAAAAAGRQSRVAGTTVVTYDVATRGVITSSIAEFKAQANATLNDARGWSRLGVVFQEVASGGKFTLVLSSSDQMTSFSPGCGSEYSCRAGRNVIINQDRWQTATTSWNEAKGSLRDYRHMVVNHETGHWLGHDHASCGGAGQPAPVMQQQSISLQGCKFNPWPTTGELWSTQLGIKKA